MKPSTLRFGAPKQAGKSRRFSPMPFGVFLGAIPPLPGWAEVPQQILSPQEKVSI
jgi:hypothetical protein